MARNGVELIVERGMQGRSIHIAHLRAYAVNEAHMADLLRTADRHGVEVKGAKHWQEERAYMQPGGMIAK